MRQIGRCEIFVPVVVVVILQVIKIEMDIYFKAAEAMYKISGRSAATKIGVNLILLFYG